jgi:ketosteroid isomerase-like protein
MPHQAWTGAADRPRRQPHPWVRLGDDFSRGSPPRLFCEASRDPAPGPDARDTGRAMSQDNVEVVRRAIAALNSRDIDGYLACCAEDIELTTPWAEVGGVYQGPDAIRRFFGDLSDAGPDFALTVERVQSVGTGRVLAFLRASATGRTSGIDLGKDVPTGNIYDFVDGKIARIQIFVDGQKALEAAGLRE